MTKGAVYPFLERKRVLPSKELLFKAFEMDNRSKQRKYSVKYLSTESYELFRK